MNEFIQDESQNHAETKQLGIRIEAVFYLLGTGKTNLWWNISEQWLLVQSGSGVAWEEA